MFWAFKNRRPWAASLICLILSPLVGMLYLNRGWYAVLYWLAALALAACVWALWPGLISTSNISTSAALISLPFNVVASVHGYFLAGDWSAETRLKWYAHWYSAIGVAIVLPFALAFGIRTFLFQPFYSASSSMSPSLNQGDSFFVSKYAYWTDTPERGDVIVFHAPKLGADFVKRIVGLPGDRVQMKDGVLFINDAPARQNRLPDFIEPCASGSVCKIPQFQELFPNGRAGRVLNKENDSPGDNTSAVVVPPGMYFVLGDDRDNSSDSRNDIGYVARGEIVGRAAYKYMAAGRWTWEPIN